MSEMLPIDYRGFYDVPRNFLVKHRGVQFLFSCPFDEDEDRYPESYKVYVLDRIQEQHLQADWEDLPAKASQLLGAVPVSDVRFDPTRRKEIDAAVLDNLLTIADSKRV